MRSPDKIMQIEILPLIRKYQSGRVERLSKAKEVPASFDPLTRVSSIDITINPSTLLTARLYLPPPSVTSSIAGRRKFPIVIYYHGGGFCTLSHASQPYHTYLNSLVSKAKVVGISVGYRLAPEHPLPAAYEDCWEALLWVMNQSVEKCIAFAEVGDLSRLFLAGESAGANIVHNMGIRLQENGMHVEGLVMVHPLFWGKERKEGKVKKDSSIYRFEVKYVDALWPFVCPSSVGLDDPWLNPMSAGVSLARLGCRRIIVTVAEQDTLREWGVAYYDKLKEDGWGNELEFFESKGEGHTFHIFQPLKKNAVELMQRLVHFINYDTEKMGQL